MKKIIPLLIMLTLCLVSSVSLHSFAANSQPPAKATEDSWYLNQLDEESVKFYDAIDLLTKQENFNEGAASINLVQEGVVTLQQLEAFANGDTTIAQAFQNARDAFMRDKYEFFFVDYTKLTVRVGQVDGKFVAYLNSGENANYYADGFTSKAQVEAALTQATKLKNEITAKMKVELDKYLETDDSVYHEDRIAELAHDYLINALSYTYLSASSPYVATVYALADKKANCVGYATLFKWIMDDFNLPCVLVSGTAENSQRVLEEHMWNYVLINRYWYAVDVTWDDPMQIKRSAQISRKHLLRGSSDFSAGHFESGILSPGGKEFAYPTITEMSFYESTLLQDESSEIKFYAKKAFSDGEECTDLVFTYKNMTMEELAAEGLFIAGRFTYYGKAPQPWVPMDALNLSSKDGMYRVAITRRGSIELCITTKDVNRPTYAEDLSLEGNHTTITKPFVLPYYSHYVSPPFIYKCEPSLARKIEAEKTHYTVEYDDELVLLNSNEPISAIVYSSEDLPSKVENLTMKYSKINMPGTGERVSTIIEFDFTPDTSYQSYINIYNVQLLNAVGKSSRKIPNPISVCVSFEMSIPCPSMVSAGYVPNKAFVYSLPTLVVNPNADIFEYDGSSSPSALDIRLVATIPNDDKKQEFEEASGETDIQASAVYDLSLACQNYMARLKSADYNLTIGLPYPEGFNYNKNPNVEFKAYHYIKQPDGSFIAEEIVCRIGERGLEVVVNSFSPFMIVAVPKTNKPVTQKLINASVMSRGGDITTQIKSQDGSDITVSSSGLYALKEGSKTFNIVAQDGFVVDKVLLNGKPINPNSNQVTFAYETMAGDNDLQAFFMAESVKDAEIEEGFDYVPQARYVLLLKIASLPKTLTFTVGQKLDVSGMVVNAEYNDGKTATLNNLQYGLSITDSLTEADSTVKVYLIGDDSIYDTFNITVNKKSNTTLVIVICLIAVVISGAVLTVVFVKKRKKA